MRANVRLLAALVLVLVCGCEPRRPVAQPPASRLDAALAEREKKLAEAQRKLLDLLEREKESRSNRSLDTSRALEDIRRVRQALGRVVVTELDTSALRAYCRGDLDEAQELLERSERSRPGRAFPAYFLGAIALERGRRGRAIERVSAPRSGASRNAAAPASWLGWPSCGHREASHPPPNSASSSSGHVARWPTNWASAGRARLPSSGHSPRLCWPTRCC